jgi:hypothetical protein
LFLAGSWFAAAFSIPVLFLWFGSDKTPITFLFFVAPSLIVAFLCGEAFGSDILKPGLIQDSKNALVKGSKIAVLTYGFFTPVFALLFAVYECGFHRNPHEWLTVQFIEKFFTGLFYVSIVGTIIFGWLMAILGAIAGWSLYQFRLFQERP